MTGVGAGRLRFELQVSDPSWLRFGRLGTAVFLVAGCLAITIWQLAFMHETAEPDRTYSLDSGRMASFRDRPRSTSTSSTTPGVTP